MSVNILDQPQFAVLRAMSLDELSRINLATAKRNTWQGCPLNQACFASSRANAERRLYGAQAGQTTSVYKFTHWWDGEAEASLDYEPVPSKVLLLTRAIAEAIREKEAAAS